MIHDSILPSKKIHDLDQGVFVTPKRPKLDGHDGPPTGRSKKMKAASVTKGIEKNRILDEYSFMCQKTGAQHTTSTVRQGKPTNTPTTYPTISQLVRDCKMKPSLRHQYRVDDLTLNNVIVILMREEEGYLLPACVANITVLNKLYYSMACDVRQLRDLDFTQLRNPRYDY